MFVAFPSVCNFISFSEAAEISSGCDDIQIEGETRSQFERRRAFVTRHLVPLAGSVSVPFASTSRERSRELLEGASDNAMYHFRWGYFVAFHDCSSFFVLVVSDHFSNDLAVTPINATGHQLVTLCRSICAEEAAEILDPLRSIKFCRHTVHVCFLVCSFTSWLFTGLNDVLGRVEHME